MCRPEEKIKVELPHFTNEVSNLTPKVRDVLKIFCKRGEIAHYEQLLLLSTIFCYLLLDFHVKTGTRFSPPDKRLFEINEFKITRVDCIRTYASILFQQLPERDRNRLLGFFEKKKT